MFNKRVFLVLVTIILSVFLAFLSLEKCSPIDTKMIAETDGNAFIGDGSCKSCHSKQYTDWLHSDHQKAMQTTNDTTVLGDFNDRSFSANGIKSQFFKKNGKYFINTQGDDGKNHDFEVKYTFGFRPLQQYLVEFPGGRMQVPRESWNTDQNKWYHQYAGKNISPHDWLHWTGNAQNWNTMCASCHSTNLRKNYDIESDTYHTTYSVINVSCESCHGPAKLHVDYVNSQDYKGGQKVTGSYILLNNRSDQLTQINTCAKCHSLKGDIHADLDNSREIMDDYIPEIPSTDHYHADGQIDEESYTYTSFLQSKMFRRNVSCSNCHNPHSGKLLFTANQLCLQCHSKTYDSPSHSFHTAGIEASECISCHMPGKMYMGIDLRHDHSLRVPRPDLSMIYGTTNACNNCHTDKTSQWAAAAIKKWYGPERKYHFADDLVPGSKLDLGSEQHLVKLLGDSVVPTIVKATAAYYLGSISTQTALQALIQCLTEHDAQIRYRALRSLANFPPAKWKYEAAPLLGDNVRAVRIAAADLFNTIPSSQIPKEYAETFAVAHRELENYLAYQADFALGNIMIADHYLQLQDYYNAEKYYLRGLKKDSLMNYARLNLSSVYSAQGKNDMALQVLKTAEKMDSRNERIYYNLALLSNEMNDKPGAEKYFAKAVDLKTTNPRVYYNYGLLLKELGKPKVAERILQKGILMDPSSSDLYYALTLAYFESGDIAKARQTGLQLKLLDPDNPGYRELFRQLGI